jgi:hypothetical protein
MTSRQYERIKVVGHKNTKQKERLQNSPGYKLSVIPKQQNDSTHLVRV